MIDELGDLRWEMMDDLEPLREEIKVLQNALRELERRLNDMQASWWEAILAIASPTSAPLSSPYYFGIDTNSPSGDAQ